MSKQPTVAFKAKDREALEAYEQEREKQWEEYRSKVKALREKLGKDLMVRNGFRELQVTGYAAEDRNEKPIPGFRRDARTGTMMPHRSTKIGKAIAAEMDDAKYVPKDAPGIGGMILRGNYMAKFLVQKFGDDWYAWLTVPVDKEPLQHMRDTEYGRRGDIDLDIWEEVKLSEWHQMAEQEPRP